LTNLQVGGEPSIALLFLADDSLYANLGRSLYAHEPLFRERFDECAKLRIQSAGPDISDALNTPETKRGAEGSTVSLTQPAQFAVQYALAQVLMNMGARPAALMGCGVGEYAAACLAGVLTPGDALRAVAAREQVSRELPIGDLPESALKTFVAQLAGIKLSAPRIPFVSGMTGAWVTPAQASDPYHWARQLRTGARLREGLEELSKEPQRVLVEVGIGRSLDRLPEGERPHAAQTKTLPLTGEADAVSGREIILRTLGWLWLAGVEIDWKKLYAKERRRRLRLPTYPFERRRYWIES